MLWCRKEEKKRSGGGIEYIQKRREQSWNGASSGGVSGGLKAGRGKYRIVAGKIPCDGMDCGAGLGLGRESPPRVSAGKAGEMVFPRHHMVAQMVYRVRSRKMSGRV